MVIGNLILVIPAHAGIQIFSLLFYRRFFVITRSNLPFVALAKEEIPWQSQQIINSTF